MAPLEAFQPTVTALLPSVSPGLFVEPGVRLDGMAGIDAFSLVAEQLAFVPPLLPLQLQLHGPLPDTVPAAPAEHKFVLGTLDTATPLELPHEPFVAVVCLVAEQLAFVPPLLPLQLQFHGPLPVSALADPAEHKFEDGALETTTLLALPHDPFVATGVGVVFGGFAQVPFVGA